jgi:hypothetical protein
MIALKNLGHEVHTVDTAISPYGTLKRLVAKVLNRMGWPLDSAGVNAAILRAMQLRRYDILWLDKVLTVRANTLKKVTALHPDCARVFYSPDDQMNSSNQSRYYLGLLPWLNIHFTTKSYNVEELKAIGCPRVYLIGNGYCPEIHRPWDLTSGELARWQSEVGFIGGFEKERFHSMLRLAKKGIVVHITGSFWRRVEKAHTNLRFSHGDLVAADYSKAICATKINLCFLRKINRDLVTTRSIEIPACGGFMLAERTDGHLALFKEGEEAEFFDSDDELFDKVQYYLSHPNERQRIAAAGRTRCLRSRYSNEDRMHEMLGAIKNQV